MTPPHILVVEDEAIVAANIEMRLQSLGYTVPAVVDSGEEALSEIERLHPHLVLMDIRLAGPMDGITAAERIRARYATPVVYLTAYTDDETIQRAKLTEPYGYILKPFEISELRTVVELALYRHVIETRAQAQAQRQKLESLAVIASGIAHDYNNLLAVILGNTSLALYDLPYYSPVRELIIPIETAARRAAELTRQMLAYAGKDRLVAVALDLNLLVQETLKAMAGNIPADITVEYHFDQGAPEIIADMLQIGRVIRNLVMNAIEAIGDQSGTITITTETRQIDSEYITSVYLSPNLPPGIYIALTVADTGSGMDSHLMERMFEPFFSTRFAGRGLGLAEVLGIMSAHRGMIKFESVVDHGTLCTVLLPVQTYSEPALSDNTITGSFSTQRGLLLLIIEDKELLESIARTLERAGFAVLKAADTTIGTNLFRSYMKTIACVMLDTALVRDGDSALITHFQTIKPAAKIILLSENQEEQEALGKQHQYVLQKRFNSNALHHILEQVLASNQKM